MKGELPHQGVEIDQVCTRLFKLSRKSSCYAIMMKFFLSCSKETWGIYIKSLAGALSFPLWGSIGGHCVRTKVRMPILSFIICLITEV